MQNLGSALAGIMFMWAMFQQYFPYDLRRQLEKYGHRLLRVAYPYIQITFHEFERDNFMRSEVYNAIETYLAASNSAAQAKRFTAATSDSSSSRRNDPDNSKLVLTIADHEEVVDEFRGVKVWWASSSITPKAQTISFWAPPEDKKYYKLTFHKNHRDAITTGYLQHVLDQGRAIKHRNRKRKLYTNYGSRWSHITFDLPAKFDTIGMDPVRKQEIIDDLVTFSTAEEFYARIGRAWKRGYLLYGPPGTGKTSLIAAMANLLCYDVYDLELTAVKNNTELRKLLIQTTSKSLIVIEDIDCSLDLTGQRKEAKKQPTTGGDDDSKEGLPVAAGEDLENKSSKVTLSGLLNFIDGLWSACKGERLVVFTTNFKDKLDPALIRKGRMDKHIELSYCKFEAFKVLAHNYLGVDAHPKFEEIGQKLEEVDITPADVAECLMPKNEVSDVELVLGGLIEELERAKEAARVKAEEDAKKLKEEEDAAAAAAAAAKEEEEAKKLKAEEDAGGGKDKDASAAKEEEASTSKEEK